MKDKDLRSEYLDASPKGPGEACRFDIAGEQADPPFNAGLRPRPDAPEVMEMPTELTENGCSVNRETSMIESNQPEVILSVVGEGGGYTIEGLQTAEGWKFRLESGGMDPDSDSWYSRHSEWTASLDEAISKMGPSWVNVYPDKVHPAFARVIWIRLVAIAKDELNSCLPIERWSEMLLGRPAKSLAEAIAYADGALMDSTDTPSHGKTDDDSGDVPKHWWPFADRLMTALRDMKEDQFLVLSLKESNRFVQFAAQGAHGMRVEATSNHFLSGRERLDDKQVRALVRLGWRKPTGTPEQSTPELDTDGSSNFFLDLPEPVDYFRVVDLAIHTLTQVFGVPHEGFLQYEAFDYAGNSYALPDLQLKHQVRDPKLQMAELADRLLDILQEATGLADLEFDADGDVQLRSYGRAFFIQLVGHPPMIRFFAPLLENVRTTRKLLDHVNLLNVNGGPLRYIAHKGALLGVLDIPAYPLQFEHVTASLERFASAVHGAAEWLQMELAPTKEHHRFRVH